MSIEDKIAYLWKHHYERALGCSHSDPFAYADAQVAHLNAQLRRVERAQIGLNQLRVGSRAGRRQAAERRALHS